MTKKEIWIINILTSRNFQVCKNNIKITFKIKI